MYAFKKLLGPLLMPLPIGLVLLFAGVVLLWWRQARSGKVLVTVGLLWLLLFSLRPVPHALLGRLEATYPAHLPAAPDTTIAWIVILDGGSSSGTKLPPPDRLSRSTLFRLVEGIRLLSVYSKACLLLSGGPLSPTLSTADQMRAAALVLGIDSTRIVLERAGNDTSRQAAAVGTYVGADPFILVTSAAHMPRAMALFEAQGLSPIPAPTEHLARPTRLDPTDFYPEAYNLEKATTWFYETLGLAWSRLRGEA